MPTFCGWLKGRDLAVKRALAIDPGESDEERQAAIDALRNALTACGVQTLEAVSVTGYLGTTPSRLLVVTMEDALEAAEQVNLPGTVDEHPNWRRRLTVSLEDLSQQSALSTLAQVMARAGRSSDTRRT
jgi:4-alpha-glucanotransferase